MGNGAMVNGGTSDGALRTLRSRLLAASLALLAFAALAGPARAETFTVTNTNDSGEGSLRDAIGRGNADPATADTIEFAPSIRGQITLTSGWLPVNSNLSIAGPGATALTISGDNRPIPVFSISELADTVSISGLTIADAQEHGILHVVNAGKLTVSDSLIRNNGNPGVVGGGIYTETGELVLDNTTIRDNTAAIGGGISGFDSSLKMRGSTVLGNQATSSDLANAGGGGIDLRGNAADTATVEDSTITGNTTARNGGGISVVGVTATVTSSTLQGNQSAPGPGPNDGGGGLHAFYANATVRDSTINANEAARGAGINAVASRVTVANTTISGNLIPGGLGIGGGINSHSRLQDGGSFERSDLTVLNSTVTGNGGFGGIANQGDSTAAIGNSIVASDDQNNDLISTSDYKGPGAFTSLGDNLIGSGDGGSGFTNGQNGDKVGTNSAPIRPKLGPLADNGGSTRTHALLSGSPALDAGTNLVTDAGGNPVTSDQRGLSRPVDFPSVANASGGDASDIGAYEAQAQPATNLTVNTLSGEDGGACTEEHCSLREAIGAADGSSDRSTIGFSVTGTIPLAGPLPGISTPIEITGPGARRLTVDGGGTHRVFSIEGGESTISDLKIVGGRAGGGAGGNVNKTGGSLTLNRVSISGGDASEGGGIANTGGSLTILRSTISGNGAATGAGVYNTATLQVDTSTISGNGAAFGGGLYNGGSGATTLLGSTVTGNGAAQDGGGLRVASGTVRAGHTIIANNTADAGGPDIRGTLTSDDYDLIGSLQGATVSGMTAHDLTGVDPKLGALADNGGPTDTHALLRGSPAIDAGASGAQASTDQRGEGFARPRGIATDIGAFEAAPNEPPEIDLNGGASGTGFSTTFIGGDGPRPVVDRSALTVTDGDDTDLRAATVTLQGRPDGDAEVLRADTAGTGLTASYDSGTLTISGTAPKADYQYVLRTVTYENASESPTAGDRRIELVVNDGELDSDVAVSTVTVQAAVLDITRPTVLDPVRPAGRRVSPRANVVVTFSEAMDQTTLDATTVTLTKKGARRSVGATLRFPSAESVVLDPNKRLRRGATYTARITTGAQDLAGNALQEDKVWRFRVRP